MTMKMKWLTILAVLAVAVSGCGAASEQGNGGQGAAEPPAQESPTETTPPAEQPAEEPAEELGVETGAEVEIETSIEGMSEKVKVTEYTLTPFGIRYVLRSDMGAPAVENGQVVYKSQMGDDVATIAVEALAGVSLDEAVAEAQKRYADGYEAAELADIGTDLNGYPGKVQGFQKGNYLYGFNAFDVDGTAVVIHSSYPQDAGDGMGAVLYELIQSLKGE